MKNILLISTLLMVAGVSNAKPLTLSLVKISDYPTTAILRFETATIKSSICHLSVKELNVVIPVDNQPEMVVDGQFITAQPASNGSLKITTQKLSTTPCRLAFGPNSGSIEFTSGYELPSLSKGLYELTIDKEDYGFLKVDKYGDITMPYTNNLLINYKGTLETNVIAIGGETTGTVLHLINGDTVEIDTKSNTTFAEQLSDLNGQFITVEAALITIKGIAIPERKVLYHAYLLNKKKIN